MTDLSTRSGQDIAKSETPSLIAASKVNGTNVYNPEGESVGSIYDVMIDKRSGKVSYAVLSFGGFLGMGERYIDVTPSSIGISYDSTKKEWKGVINASKDELKSVPEFKYEGKFKH